METRQEHIDDINVTTFCKISCCCTTKVGLITCHILLIIAACLNLLVGFNNWRDIISNSFLLFYVLMAILTTSKEMRQGLILITLMTPPVIAAPMVANILNLMDLANVLDSWYPIFVGSEQVSEILFSALIFLTATISMVCGTLIVIHNIVLLKLNVITVKARIY